MEHRAFWSTYSPGFRSSDAPVGSREFFAEVIARRSAREAHIDEVVGFDRWTGCDVLEAGCGIGTDGARFAGGGARYTGMDFSPTALSLARRRFALDDLAGTFVGGSVTALPFADNTFDLVFSHGVIHHVGDTQGALNEFVRVLRPGGTALVMAYHRASLNYHVSIGIVRRSLIGLLLVPGMAATISRATGEPRHVIDGHTDLLARHGLRYVTDRNLFVSHNTDGPGNKLAKAYSRDELERMCSAAGLVSLRSEVRYLNTRLYPLGDRLAASSGGRRLERHVGWHLYMEGRKRQGPPAWTSLGR